MHADAPGKYLENEYTTSNVYFNNALELGLGTFWPNT